PPIPELPPIGELPAAPALPPIVVPPPVAAPPAAVPVQPTGLHVMAMHTSAASQSSVRPHVSPLPPRRKSDPQAVKEPRASMIASPARAAEEPCIPDRMPQRGASQGLAGGGELARDRRDERGVRRLERD